MAGYESTLLLQNLEFTFYLIALHVLLVPIYGILYPMRNSCRPIKWAHRKLGGYLNMNGLIRFYMELYFFIALTSCVNLKVVNWDSLFTAEKVSNYMSVSFLTLIGAVPLIMGFFYWKYPGAWRKPEFIQQYGVLLDEAKIKL